MYCTGKETNNMARTHAFHTDKSNKRPDKQWQNNRVKTSWKQRMDWRPLSFTYTYELIRQATYKKTNSFEVRDAQRIIIINNLYF